MTGLAAALAFATFAVLFARFLDTPEPAAIEAIVDGEVELRLENGELEIQGELPPAFTPAIEEALRTSRLPLPDIVTDLGGRTGALLSDDYPESSALDPTPIFPLGTCLKDARPVMRWRPVDGALDYRVVIADETLRVVASSPPLEEPSWQPPTALPTGQVLTWQVSATTEDGTFLAPRPPAPEARFSILTEAEVAHLQSRLEMASGSRLAIALAYAEAGLVEETRRELEALAEEQEDPAWVDRLRNTLRVPSAQ